MAWKGFLAESKLYMSYPDQDNYVASANRIGHYMGSSWEARKRRRKFWLTFPRAAIRFYWFSLQGWLDRKACE